MATVIPRIDVGDNYKQKYGFFDPEKFVFKAKRGLNPEVVKEISWMKNEPEWMTAFRLKALQIWDKKEMPTWGADLSTIDFQNIYYYLKSTEKQGKTWEDVPADIKNTFDRLGVPQAERKFLAGVAAQYESEVVYHSLHKELESKGVIVTDTDSALRDYPDLFKEYFGTIIPPGDNKMAALNSAVWSGGSFIYVPKGVKVEIPLQAYFRINAENMGQFERTLIICDEDSFVHYIEGCTAPIYTTDSLHSAVVEIVVKRGARCRYTTVQNWSTNVFNLVTKRAAAYGGRTSYRGLIKIYPGAKNSKSFVRCDALLLDEQSRSDTYPTTEVDEEQVKIGHEATVSKVSDEQLFYLQSRGITRAEAETMIVNGFIEPFTKELPIEYAVELNRLIQLEMIGSVG